MREDPINSKWVHKFLHRWQWSYQASNTKGSYLANDSKEMEDMRRQHRAQRVIGGVPFELVLNFDQLWRSGYEPPPKVLHKRKAREADRQEEEWGECRPSDLVGKRLQAVLSVVEGEMKKRMGQTNKSALRKGVPRTEFVQGGRAGVTAVTSTWANGEIGPLGVCVCGKWCSSFVFHPGSQQAMGGSHFPLRIWHRIAFYECGDDFVVPPRAHSSCNFAKPFLPSIYIYVDAVETKGLAPKE